MGNYYYLAASLPTLELGGKPDISSVELKNRLQINLSKEDWEQTVVFRRFIDIQNIRALFLEEPIDPRGNLNEKELDEALLIHNILPQYVFDFLGRYETVAEKLKHFAGLIALFYSEEIPKQKGFLARYLRFEREWRLVMVGLRAKALGRDVFRELQFEDPTDTIVAHILAQRDADEYEPPVEYRELKEIFENCASDPWELHKAIAAWRFHVIEQLVDKPLFSFDWILSYMAQLIIIEDWNELDEEKGIMILDTFKTR